MKLLNELQERRRVLCEARDVMRADLLQTEAELYDLYRAIGALEPTVKVMPELEPELQDDASEFAEVSESKPFRVYSERGDVAGVQSFDTITQARAFANEEISLDAKKIEVFSGDDRLFEWPVVEAEPLADPIWNEPEPTKPEADFSAKAHDYYDPKAVAERERRNPFNIFKREGDQ